MYHLHYVYTHTTEDGRMIYCGIGVEGRAWEQTKRDPYHRDLLKSFDHDYVELIATHLTKDEALLKERRTIRSEDPICNINERIKL